MLLPVVLSGGSGTRHWPVSGEKRPKRLQPLLGDEIILLGENESTYILPGGEHRLGNQGQIPLEIIEVQSDSHLGEDDIVRSEDTYGR